MGVKCKGVTTREDGWRLKGERQKGGDWETARGGVKNGRWKSGDHEEVGFRLERKVWIARHERGGVKGRGMEMSWRLVLFGSGVKMQGGGEIIREENTERGVKEREVKIWVKRRGQGKR